MEAFVEALVEVNSMEASMQAFVEITKASVKITFTEVSLNLSYRLSWKS